MFWLLIAAFPLLFTGVMAGDSVIHLVFAEHAARGDWLAFNSGEHFGGETSLGYLLLVTAILRLTGSVAAPYVMIALGYTAWIGMLAAGWNLLRRCQPNSPWPWLWLAIAGLMPGSVFNSVLGMENILFAAGFLAIIAWMHRTGALEEPLSTRREALLVCMLGALTWLRPEAFPLAGIVFGWRCCAQAGRIGWRRSLVRQVWAGSGVAALFAASIATHLLLSGQTPFSGGVARLNMTLSHGGILLGGVLPLHGKMATRMACYAPLTVLFALGAWQWRRNPRCGHRGVTGLVVMLTLGALLLFSTVLPTEHLARYTIFLWPLMALVAIFGFAALWETGGWWRPLLVVAFGGILLVYAAELRSRWGMRLYGQHLLSDVAHAQERRAAATDALLAELGYSGPLPVSVGFGEVQMRYFYDSRVVVRTLDGIIDNRFNAFVHRAPGGVVYNYTGYFKACRLDYILEYPNLADADAWSLAALESLTPGTVIERDGVRFERLPGRVTRVRYGAGSL